MDVADRFHSVHDSGVYDLSQGSGSFIGTNSFEWHQRVWDWEYDPAHVLAGKNASVDLTSTKDLAEFLRTSGPTTPSSPRSREKAWLAGKNAIWFLKHSRTFSRSSIPDDEYYKSARFQPPVGVVKQCISTNGKKYLQIEPLDRERRITAISRTRVVRSDSAPSLETLNDIEHPIQEDIAVSHTSDRIEPQATSPIARKALPKKAFQFDDAALNRLRPRLSLDTTPSGLNADEQQRIRRTSHSRYPYVDDETTSRDQVAEVIEEIVESKSSDEGPNAISLTSNGSVRSRRANKTSPLEPGSTTACKIDAVTHSQSTKSYSTSNKKSPPIYSLPFYHPDSMEKLCGPQIPARSPLRHRKGGAQRHFRQRSRPDVPPEQHPGISHPAEARPTRSHTERNKIRRRSRDDRARARKLRDLNKMRNSIDQGPIDGITRPSSDSHHHEIGQAITRMEPKVLNFEFPNRNQRHTEPTAGQLTEHPGDSWNQGGGQVRTPRQSATHTGLSTFMIDSPTSPDSHFTGSLTLDDNNSLSPIMLVAEQVDVPRGRLLKKPATLILRPKPSLPSEDFAIGHPPPPPPPPVELARSPSPFVTPLLAATEQPRQKLRSARRGASSPTQGINEELPETSTSAPDTATVDKVTETNTREICPRCATRHTTQHHAQQQLVSRVTALERQNKLLEAALMAVLKVGGSGTLHDTSSSSSLKAKAAMNETKGAAIGVAVLDVPLDAGVGAEVPHHLRETPSSAVLNTLMGSLAATTGNIPVALT